MSAPDFGAFAEKHKTKKQLAEDKAAAIAKLEADGYVVHKPRPPREGAERVDITHLMGKDRLRLGVVSCTHFGSKYQQLTALREFCTYAAPKVDAFVHGGDLTDGPTTRHRNPHEVFKHDFDAMLDYAADVLPATGKPWYVIGGNHDRWYKTDGGPDIIKALCERRDDLTYLGQDLGYLTFKDTNIEVYHFDSATAYAWSYKAQKHIESLDASRKPAVSLIANFHKFCALYYRNVFAVQLPSFQAQSAWMASKSLVSEVGGVILDVGLHPKGLAPATSVEVVYTYDPREGDWP